MEHKETKDDSSSANRHRVCAPDDSGIGFRRCCGEKDYTRVHTE